MPKSTCTCIEGDVGARGIALSVDFMCDITVFFISRCVLWYRPGLRYVVFGDFGLRYTVKFKFL